MFRAITGSNTVTSWKAYETFPLYCGLSRVDSGIKPRNKWQSTVTTLDVSFRSPWRQRFSLISQSGRRPKMIELSEVETLKEKFGK